MFVRLRAAPRHLDSITNGDIPMALDACNLGTAATYFFWAGELAEKAGNLKRRDTRLPELWTATALTRNPPPPCCARH